MPDDGIDWTGTPEPVAREILAQGQVFMQAQLQSALASDQRATTMATILLTGSTAVFAAVVALSDKLADDAVAGLLVMAVTLLVAASIAAWAARPVDFYYPGLRPEQLYDCRLEDLTEMIGGAAEEVQRSIDENETIMDKNQESVRAGFILAVASPILGALIWWLA